MRGLVLLSLLSTTGAVAAPAAGLFCPLEVQANPKLKPVEALQRRFFSAARDNSGLSLALRLETETAIGASGLSDFKTSDASLARVAQLAKVLYAGYATLLLSPKNELVLTARVVRDDGQVVATAQVIAPRGKEPLPDALISLTERLFLELRTKELPATRPPSKAEPKPAPVVIEVKQLEPRPEPVVSAPPPPPPLELAGEPLSKPGSNLRPIGFVLAGAGAAIGAGGAVLYGTAGSVRRDEVGNVFFEDARLVTDIRTKQGLGLGMLVGGGVIAGAGLVMALLFANDAPTAVTVLPVSDGAVVSVGGSF